MAELKNSCSSCVHAPVCKYTEAVKKSMYDIAKIANDHFEAHDFNGLIDLSIRCRQYVMAHHHESDIDRHGTNAFLQQNDALRNTFKIRQE